MVYGDLREVWLFTGQGTVKVNAGYELYKSNASFRTALIVCDEIMRRLIGKGCIEILYPSISGCMVEEAERLLLDNQYAQPVLVSFEYSLSMALKALGHSPHAVLGHSLGEYAAGVASGVMSIQSCLELVCARAKLVANEESCRGVMLAVRSNYEEATRAVATCATDVSIAAVNGPRSVVLSGSSVAVNEALEVMGSPPSQKLNVTHAFHSPLMSGILPAFEAELNNVKLHEPNCTLVSTVLGRAVRAEEITKSNYWLKHLTDTVQFEKAVKCALDLEYTQFVEVGPDLTLTKLATTIGREVNQGDDFSRLKFSSVVAVLANSVASADLPSPPLQIVVAAEPSKAADTEVVVNNPSATRLKTMSKSNVYHRLIHSLKREEFSGLTVVKSVILPSLLSDWAGHHVIGGRCVFPGGGFLDLAVATARHLDMKHCEGLWHCEGFVIRDTLPVDAVTKDCQFISLLGTVDASGEYALYRQAREQESKAHLVSCRFSPSSMNDFQVEDALMNDRISSSTASTETVDIEKWYAEIKDSLGMDYGPSFKLVKSITICGSARAQSVISLTAGGVPRMKRDHLVPPTVVDAVFQTALALITQPSDANTRLSVPFVPYAIDKIWVASESAVDMWHGRYCTCDVQLTKNSEKIAVFDARLTSASGSCVMILKNVYARALDSVVDLKVNALPKKVEGISLLRSIWVEKPMRKSTPTFDLEKCLVVSHGNEKDVHRLFGSALSVVHYDLDKTVDFTGGFAASIVVVSLSDCDDPMINMTILAKYITALKHCCQNTNRVVVCTPLAQDKSGNIFQESLIGIVLSVSTEFPEVQVSLILDSFGNLDSDVYLSELNNTIVDTIVKYDTTGHRMVPQYMSMPKITGGIQHRPIKAVIITGGLGALGLLTARVFANSGVKSVVLVSRSMHSVKVESRLHAELQWLREKLGAELHIIECDVSDESEVEAMLNRSRELVGSIDAIVHSAGVLRDGLLSFKPDNEIIDNFQMTWNAKVLGALWLHKHTVQDKLRVFWTFSSITAAIGNAGQVLYGGANAALDSLAVYRNRLGLAGTSIQWPAVSEIGMATKALSHKKLNSTTSIAPDSVMEVMDCLLKTVTEDTAVVTVVPEGLKKDLKQSAARHHFEAILSETHEIQPPIIRKAECTADLSKEDLTSIVLLEATKLMSSVVSLNSNLMENGLDSMGATELSVELSNKLGLRLLPTLALTYGTVIEIVEHCWEQMRHHKVVGDAAVEAESLKDVVQQVRLSLEEWANVKAGSMADGCTLKEFLTDSITLDALQSKLAQTFAITWEVPLNGVHTVRQVIEMIVHLKGFAQALLDGADIQSVAKGDIYRENPWFANYFCSKTGDAIRGRVILFGGLAQPTISWYRFAKVMNEEGLHVHVVRLPGRFDRPLDEPLLDSEEITKNACQAMQDLGFLDLPIFCFGYSYGALMAYSCAQYLEHRLSVTVQHFLCISGPHRSQFDKWKFMDPEDRDVNTMKEISIHNLGSHNPNFDMNFQYMPDILEYFFTVLNRDYSVCKSWVNHYDMLTSDERRLSCDVTCIAGVDDKCVNNKGWREITGGNYQQTFFPGDHFFIFSDANFDEIVAKECCRAMLRSLRIYI